MSIICGTDFSPAAREATDIAARLSCRLNEELVLVHAVAPQASDPITVDLGPVRAAMAEALESEAAGVRSKGLQVTTLAEMGSPDEVLLEPAPQPRCNVHRLASRRREVRSADDGHRPSPGPTVPPAHEVLSDR